jgi:hypothetical protein
VHPPGRRHAARPTGAPFSFQSGMSSSRARGSNTLPETMWAPTSCPFSTTQTLRSLLCCAASCFSLMADDSPAGPAPTMTTSYSTCSRAGRLSAVDRRRATRCMARFGTVRPSVLVVPTNCRRVGCETIWPREGSGPEMGSPRNSRDARALASVTSDSSGDLKSAQTEVTVFASGTPYLNFMWPHNHATSALPCACPSRLRQGSAPCLLR